MDKFHIHVFLLALLVLTTGWTAGSPSPGCRIGDERVDPKDLDLLTPAGPNPRVCNRSFTLHFNATVYHAASPDDSWDMVTIDGCSYESRAGQAVIPFYSKVLTIPGSLGDITVDLRGKETLCDINLPPSAAPVPAPAFPTTEEARTEPAVEEDHLTGTGFYPQRDHELSPVGKHIRDGVSWHVYNLKIFPFRYNQAQKTATLFKEAAVTFSWEIGPEPIPATRSGPGGIEYIILTSGPLTDELQCLADWKTRKGVPAEVVDVTDIYSSRSGYDQPEKIRNFLMERYSAGDLKYVLLAGDHDTVPVRLCFDPYWTDPYQGTSDATDKTIATDSYYSCLDAGTSWDVDGDHIYGEPGELDDILPDIAVGRIAINDQALMEGWVTDMIAYEREPPPGDWFGDLTLVGTNVHNEGDGADHLERLYNTYLEFGYPSVNKMYESSPNATSPVSYGHLMNSINDGTSLLFFQGHGTPRSWQSNFDHTNILYTADFDQFTNGVMKPVISTMSCGTCFFDDPSKSAYPFTDCMGELFTECPGNGALAYIGSTRTTYNLGTPGYSSDAEGFLEDLARNLDPTDFRPGEAFRAAKWDFASSWGDKFETQTYVQKIWLVNILFGDPEVPVWTGQPESFVVTNTTSTTDSQTLMNVGVADDQGGALAGIMVCASDGEFYMRVLTDASGEAVFSVPLSHRSVNITVTGPGYIPHDECISLYKPEVVTNVTFTPDSPVEGDTLTLDWKIDSTGLSGLTGVPYSIFHQPANGTEDALDEGTISFSQFVQQQHLSTQWEAERGHHRFRLVMEPVGDTGVDPESWENEVSMFVDHHDLTINCPSDSSRALPGESLSFDIEVYNTGTLPDKFDIWVDDSTIPQGWEVESSSAILELGKGSGGDVTVDVSIPSNASADDHVLTVWAVSRGLPGSPASVNISVSVEQVHGIALNVSRENRDALPGEKVLWNITVKNTGNGPDEVKLTVVEASSDWDVSLSQDSVSIEPSEEAVVGVEMTVPAYSWAGNLGTVTVHAESSDISTCDECTLSARTRQVFDMELSMLEVPPFKVDPSDHVEANIVLANTGNGYDTFSLDITAPADWTAQLSQLDLYLDPDDERIVLLTVAPPPDAQPGNYSVTVRAGSSDPSVEESLDVLLTVNRVQDVILDHDTSTLSVKIGEKASFHIDIVNTGNEELAVTPVVDLADLNGHVSVDPDVLVLGPGDCGTVIVSVSPPDDLEPGIYEMKIHASLSGSGSYGAFSIEVEVLDGDAVDDGTETDDTPFIPSEEHESGNDTDGEGSDDAGTGGSASTFPMALAAAATVTALVVAAVLYLLMVRKKGKGPAEDAGDGGKTQPSGGDHPVHSEPGS